MNVRKPVDYSELYRGIDVAMSLDHAQMELYYEIGHLVNTRAEKGAAVAAAEYIQANYPAASGFSPRNVRRMRDFYRLYKGHPKLLKLARKLSWTQNVVIMEAEVAISDLKWYLVNTAKHQWTKLELLAQITSMAHKGEVCDEKSDECVSDNVDAKTSNEDFTVKSGYYFPVQMRQFLLEKVIGEVGSRAYIRRIPVWRMLLLTMEHLKWLYRVVSFRDWEDLWHGSRRVVFCI